MEGTENEGKRGEFERELARAEAAWATSYGAGSRRELRERYERAQAGAGEAASPAELLSRVEAAHREKYGTKSLAAEARDERLRDAAVTDDGALVQYEARWSSRLARLQRLYPGRWRVPGFSEDELRDELTLRLIDAVRTRPDELAAHHRAGKEWGLLFLARQRRMLQKDFRLEVVLADLSPALDRGLSGEEQLIEQQAAGAMALARERAEGGLSRPQRRWLAAMKMTANAGAFFESSGQLNLAAVSRLLDRDRSSAHRAFGELQRRFTRELKKLGG